MANVSVDCTRNRVGLDLCMQVAGRAPDAGLLVLEPMFEVATSLTWHVVEQTEAK